MPRFDLQRFLAETGLSITRLASYLQVAQTYLRQVAAGKADLTRRDREACRTLLRRLTQAEQLELPFAEPASAFTRQHARLLARSWAKTSSVRSATVDAPRGRSDKRTGVRSRRIAGNPAQGTDSRRSKGERKRGRTRSSKGRDPI